MRVVPITFFAIRLFLIENRLLYTYTTFTFYIVWIILFSLFTWIYRSLRRSLISNNEVTTTLKLTAILESFNGNLILSLALVFYTKSLLMTCLILIIKCLWVRLSDYYKKILLKLLRTNKSPINVWMIKIFIILNSITALNPDTLCSASHTQMNQFTYKKLKRNILERNLGTALAKWPTQQ